MANKFIDYKVGDKVEIIQGKKNWAQGMNQYVGRILTISEVLPMLNNDLEYQFVKFKDFEGNRMWQWQPNRHCKPYIDETQSRIIDENTAISKNGTIFKVGDKINSINSPNQPFIIKSFNLRGNIIVAKNEANNRFPCIDNIELVLKEETLLEKAKRLYPIGTKYKRFWGLTFKENPIDIITKEPWESNGTIVAQSRNGVRYIYKDNQWAEIIND